MSTFIYKKEKIGGLQPEAENVDVGKFDISSIGDGTLTGAIAAISNKSIASEEGANDLRYLNGELAVKNSSGEWIVIKTGGSSIQLNQPTGVVVTSGDEEATIKWTDPDDVIVEGFTLAEWDSTILIRKEGTTPTDETDGVVILTSTTKNQYSVNGYKDTGLTNGVTYYYGIFPKTTDDVYTTTSTISVTPAIIYPDAATNISVSTDNQNMSATVTFTLPSNTTATVVMKAGSEPSSSTDGTVLSGLETGTATFSNLVLDTTYYFKVYTYNSKNRETESTSVNTIIKSLEAPTNVTAVAGDEEATIKWTDPDDAIVEGFTLAEWDSTILVRKEGTAPTDETDGVVVLTSTVKNQYSVNGYKDTGLTNGVTYYYGIFPKTTDDVYTTTNTTTGVTPSIIYPEAATGLSVSTNNHNKSATVTFTLPSNTTATVVMKAGSEPSSSTDGTVVSGLTAGSTTFSNLVLDTTYYFKVYTYNSKNRETGSTSVNTIITLKIVTWADGSWEDIGAMIEAHYNGDINITDYWSNGDTKRVQLNAIASGTTGESQSAQYIDLTIIDSAHDDLVTSINGVTKAALTIHSKFCLGTTGYMYSAYNSPSYSLWKDSPRRTWCNNRFKNALPAGLISLIKKVSKVTYRYADKSYSSYSSYRGSTTTQDDVFLLSEMEVYGTQTLGTESDYGRGSDGTQYEYYKTASNRIKYLGIDGTSANAWWLRSSYVYSSGNSAFRNVNGSGNVGGSNANYTNGLAPAFCI